MSDILDLVRGTPRLDGQIDPPTAVDSDEVLSQVKRTPSSQSRITMGSVVFEPGPRIDSVKFENPEPGRQGVAPAAKPPLFVDPRSRNIPWEQSPRYPDGTIIRPDDNLSRLADRADAAGKKKG